ncbi:MAG: methytransferase partner Trm112 [Chloroflexota bacterium]|nr:methytransferase partner Trm112 [Chloroflexota bacterium]
MRSDLVSILVCPMCKGPLTLRVDKEDEEEVEKGALLCQRCNESYPIEESIPNLLPPGLRS